MLQNTISAVFDEEGADNTHTSVQRNRFSRNQKRSEQTAESVRNLGQQKTASGLSNKDFRVYYNSQTTPQMLLSDHADGRVITRQTSEYDGVIQRCGDSERDIEGTRTPVRNWRGEEVQIPRGHIMSPRDPDFSAPPIIAAGPFTEEQRAGFLGGNSAGTHLAPHHRHQIPVQHGGVIDEIPGPRHPDGNQHTSGSPSRHPSPSIFNSMPQGNSLRSAEIKTHWIDKGNRLIATGDGFWIDPG